MSGSKHGNKNWLYNFWVKWCPVPKLFGLEGKTCTHIKKSADPSKECCDSPASSDKHNDECSDNAINQATETVAVPNKKSTTERDDTSKKSKKPASSKKKPKKKTTKSKKK